jgi:hypothetical protein
MKPYRGPPATLGSTAAAQVRLIVWCDTCGHRTEPDAEALAEKHGAATTVPDWAARLVFSQCGSRKVSFVLIAARR